MITTPSVAGRSDPIGAVPLVSEFQYEVIATYPGPADLAKAIRLLNKEGHSQDQISILAREQDNWQEKLKHELENLEDSNATSESTVVAVFSGIAIVVGVALTGGVGLLAAGPVAAFVGVSGLGAIGGGLLGGMAAVMDHDHVAHSVEEEVQNAILKGEWVLVAHSRDEEEAKRLAALLPNSRTIHLGDEQPSA